MNKKEEALAFLKQRTTGVLATVEGGKPHASTVFYVCDDDFNIYFVTLFASRKFQAVRGNPVVAFTVSDRDVPQTVQIEGVAAELTHNDEKRAHMADLVKVLTANSRYYAPLTRLDPSEIVMLWIKPSWVRWGDFASAVSGNEHIFSEISL